MRTTTLETLNNYSTVNLTFNAFTSCTFNYIIRFSMTATSFYSFPLISVTSTVPYTRGASLILTGLSFIELLYGTQPTPSMEKGESPGPI